MPTTSERAPHPHIISEVSGSTVHGSCTVGVRGRTRLSSAAAAYGRPTPSHGGIAATPQLRHTPVS